jgi:hypothetical protein
VIPRRDQIGPSGVRDGRDVDGLGSRVDREPVPVRSGKRQRLKRGGSRFGPAYYPSEASVGRTLPRGAWATARRQPNAPPAPAGQVIDAMKLHISRVHARHGPIVGATILPMRNPAGFSRDQARPTVNNGIRTSAAFDAVLDIDAELRDPVDPTQIVPDLRLGCYHPNGAGDSLLGSFIPLWCSMSRFTGARATPDRPTVVISSAKQSRQPRVGLGHAHVPDSQVSTNLEGRRTMKLRRAGALLAVASAALATGLVSAAPGSAASRSSASPSHGAVRWVNAWQASPVPGGLFQLRRSAVPRTRV